MKHCQWNAATLCEEACAHPQRAERSVASAGNVRFDLDHAELDALHEHVLLAVSGFQIREGRVEELDLVGEGAQVPAQHAAPRN